MKPSQPYCATPRARRAKYTLSPVTYTRASSPRPTRQLRIDPRVTAIDSAVVMPIQHQRLRPRTCLLGSYSSLLGHRLGPQALDDIGASTTLAPFPWRQ